MSLQYHSPNRESIRCRKGRPNSPNCKRATADCNPTGFQWWWMGTPFFCRQSPDDGSQCVGSRMAGQSKSARNPWRPSTWFALFVHAQPGADWHVDTPCPENVCKYFDVIYDASILLWNTLGQKLYNSAIVPLLDVKWSLKSCLFFWCIFFWAKKINAFYLCIG